MSQPTDLELHQLSQVADELIETFGERGHRVGVALEADPAFGSGMSNAWLGRDLAIHAIKGSASRIGIDFRPIRGGGLELQYSAGTTDRRYRVRKARRVADGTILVLNSEASVTPWDDTLFDREQWVFAYTPSAEGLIEEVLLAQVYGSVDGTPGELLLGPPIPIGSQDTANGRFEPSNEDLHGFDDDSDNGIGESGS